MRRYGRLIALSGGALVFLFPFFYMLVGSLQTHLNSSPSGAVPNPGNLSLQNYRQIDGAVDLLRALVNSGIFTGGVILGTVVFGTLAGYALAQLHFRGRGMLFAALLLVQVVPFQQQTNPQNNQNDNNNNQSDTNHGKNAPYAIISTAVFVFRQY